MDNFSTFFNIAKEKATPNTRKHHQNLARGMNRKHHNQVARCYGHEGRKEHQLIDSIVKNKKNGKWNINPVQAKEILNAYGIKHIEDKNYSKAINRTGININYDATSKLFTLTRNS
jgi:hypothetical protein